MQFQEDGFTLNMPILAEGLPLEVTFPQPGANNQFRMPALQGINVSAYRTPLHEGLARGIEMLGNAGSRALEYFVNEPERKRQRALEDIKLAQQGVNRIDEYQDPRSGQLVKAAVPITDQANPESDKTQVFGSYSFDPTATTPLEEREISQKKQLMDYQQSLNKEMEGIKSAHKRGELDAETKADLENKLVIIQAQHKNAIEIGDKESEAKHKLEMDKIQAQLNAKPSAMVKVKFKGDNGVDMETEVPSSSLPTSVLPKELGGTSTPKQSGEKKTASQGNAMTYGSMMQQAESVFSELEKKNWDPTKTIAGIYNWASPNFMHTADRQKFEQAKDSFLNAVLRKQSGANISSNEYARAEREYFPRAGDGAGVVKQKKEARLLAIQKMFEEAGDQHDSVAKESNEISTKEEFDKLPSGASFIFNGKQGVKK